jgi:hypothetical protein
MTGYVYAVTNPSIPGLVKIGRTSNMEKRLESLYDTSVPTPFECVCVKKVNNPNDIESNLHTLLSEFRVNDKREFFKVEIEKVKLIFDLIGSSTNPVTNNGNNKTLSLKISTSGTYIGTIKSDNLATLYTIVKSLDLYAPDKGNPRGVYYHGGVKPYRARKLKSLVPAYSSLVDQKKKGWTLEQCFNFEVPPNYTKVHKQYIENNDFTYFPQRPTEDGNRKPLVATKEKRIYLSQKFFAQEHKIPADYVSDKLKLGVTPDEIILNYKSDKQE